jgi:hypothetical protein
MNPGKRKVDDAPEPVIAKKAVSQSTVTTNEFIGVIYQATRPGTPGKVIANIGIRTHEDPRFSKMATMVLFQGPSEMTAQMAEPGQAPSRSVQLHLHVIIIHGSHAFDSNLQYLRIVGSALRTSCSGILLCSVAE